MSASSIHVIGGGTVNHVRSHFALAATAYGETARRIHALLSAKNIPSTLHLTKMACAGQSKLETNKDISDLADRIIADLSCKIVFFNAAIADFEGQIGNVPSGKYATRLKSRDAAQNPVILKPSDKIVPRFKQQRPDIFLIAFKTTTNASLADQLTRGTDLLKGSGADLVLANDTGTRRNILLDSSQKILCDSMNRDDVITFMVNHACQMDLKP